MKQILILWVMLIGSTLTTLQAADARQQKRLSRDEFRTRQQVYITEKAELTPDEAAHFFPLYFELQDKKKELNDAVWQKMRQVKKEGENATDEQYGEALQLMDDNRVACDKLDRTYREKFRKVLSNKKIFQVHQAEMRFQRELVKGMQHRAHSKARNNRKQTGEK